MIGAPMEELAQEYRLTFEVERMSRRKFVIRCNGEAVGDVRRHRDTGRWRAYYGRRCIGESGDRAKAGRWVRNERIRAEVKKGPEPAPLSHRALEQMAKLGFPV